MAVNWHACESSAVLEPHVLFVGDEVPIRELLSLFVRKKGFEVTVAATASEAEELFNRVRFDLIILDVNLAGESGLDLLGLIRSKYPDLPVVIFTGLEADEEPIKKAFAGQADGFMRKPDSLDTLFAEVRRHLSAWLPPAPCGIDNRARSF
jgi:DNA-binding response OmpR family regulator